MEIDKELENVEESVRVGDNVGERGEVEWRFSPSRHSR